LQLAAALRASASLFSARSVSFSLRASSGSSPAARPLLTELRHAGMRVKTSLLDAALAKVGEPALSE
jgi:hypothetical protein